MFIINRLAIRRTGIGHRERVHRQTLHRLFRRHNVAHISHGVIIVLSGMWRVLWRHHIERLEVRTRHGAGHRKHEFGQHTAIPRRNSRYITYNTMCLLWPGIWQ